MQIHNRDAHSDTLKVVRNTPIISRRSSCTATRAAQEMARELAKLGCYISLAGPVTYPERAKSRWRLPGIPLDRLLVETDSPYLPPSPYRGQRNEPAYVVETARKIAEIRNTSFEEVAAATSANAARIFGISPGWAI